MMKKPQKLKHILLIFSFTVIIAVLFCVFCLGGLAGAFAWSFAVFILAPTAILALLVQIVILIVRATRKRDCRWNLILIIPSVLLILPITVLFGLSPITYPTNVDDSRAVMMLMPVEGATLFGGRSLNRMLCGRQNAMPMIF